MSAHRRRHGTRFDAAILVDVAFVVALAAVAAFAAWPIYQTPYLVITATGAVVIAGGVTVLGLVLRWSWFTIVLALIAGYVLLGVPLAVPRAFASRADFVLGYRDLLVATVFDWRKLATVAVPVGHYQTLLVPLLIVLLASTAAAFALIIHRVRAYAVVVPVMLLPVLFAIAFGSSHASWQFTAAGFVVSAFREIVVGVLALGLAGAFLVWRSQHARTVALRAVAEATGVRRAAGAAAGSVRRVAGAVAVVVVAVLVAVPLSSAALGSNTRHVLRTAGTAELRQYVSPLTTYRQYFDAAHYDQELLSVTGDTEQLGRLRLATMSFYDGQQFTVLQSDSDSASAFRPIPQLTSVSRDSDLATATVTVRADQGVWMPTVAGLQSVRFDGADANALTDGFYYNRGLQAGVELHPLPKGTGYSYTLAASRPAPAPALESASAPSTPVRDTTIIPKSLTDWIESQGVGSGGGALVTLIDRLRQRGYLSHSLAAANAAQKAPLPEWASDLGMKQVESSLAGESTGRIDALFTALNNQQQRYGASAPASELVAAVGDDEQFAVASALIAESLGFPARVVLGFSLSQAAAGDPATSIPPCADGVCRGKNLTAWVEVRVAGSWVPIGTTPQHTAKLATSRTPTSVPQLPTQVQQRGATVQPPPEANPSGDSQQNPPRTNHPTAGAADWMPLVRLIGSILLVLLVLVAPLVALLIVKAARRRERRAMSSTAGRMAAGWDELVDTAVDLGLPTPGVRTRAEAAAVYAAASRSADSARMRTLASGADEAVFGAFDPTAQEAEQYWAQLDEQRARLAAGFPRWKRLWALISLRSFRAGGGGDA